GGAAEGVARLQCVAIVDCGLDGLLRFRQQDVRSSPARPSLGGRKVVLRMLCTPNPVHPAQLYQPGGCLRRKTIGSLVCRIERAPEHANDVASARLQGDLQMVALAGIANIGKVAPASIAEIYLLPCHQCPATAIELRQNCAQLAKIERVD